MHFGSKTHVDEITVFRGRSRIFDGGKERGAMERWQFFDSTAGNNAWTLDILIVNTMPTTVFIVCSYSMSTCLRFAFVLQIVTLALTFTMFFGL